MARTVYLTATSFDGFIADEHHSLQWLFDADHGPGDHGFAEFFAGVGAVCLGRTTYDWVIGHEGIVDDDGWHRAFEHRPTWLFTHGSPAVFRGVRVVGGDVRPVHAAMCEAAGERDRWIVGGGALAARFAEAGLLDEIRLSIAPVALGAGAPLLPTRLGSDRLQLLSVERSGAFAQLVYGLLG